MDQKRKTALLSGTTIVLWLIPSLVSNGYGAEVFEDVMRTPYPKDRIQPAATPFASALGQ